MNYPSWSHSDESPPRPGGVAAELPGTAVHTLSVDPRHSMKAATAELDDALGRLGADMRPSTRRQTALLASELIAQVAGRDVANATGSVDLTVKLTPHNVRLETRGPTKPSVSNGSEPDAANVLAEWGHFLLNRLASRWGIDRNSRWILWAEVDLA